MFALFEAISNKLLVFYSLLLSFSFMKTMIHSSALRRVGQRLFLRQPTSPAHVGKKPSSESSSLSKTRGKYLFGNATCLSLCLSRQN